MKLAKFLAEYVILCIGALALVAAFAAITGARAPLHPTQPPFDDPEIDGECAEWEFQYDTGDEMLINTPVEDYDEPGEWVPYLFSNGPTGYTPDPVACNSVARGEQYATAGELGANVWIELRTNPFTEIPSGWVGIVFWATEYTDPFWEWPWGWCALNPDSIYATWQFTNAEKLMVNIDGDPALEHVGWQRLYTNPSNPALEGVRVFSIGVIANATLTDGKFSETWMKTFTDLIQ